MSSEGLKLPKADHLVIFFKSLKLQEPKFTKLPKLSFTKPLRLKFTEPLEAPSFNKLK